MENSEHLSLEDFLEINYAPRIHDKPRDLGVTMVMDQGWPNGFTREILEDYGQYLDIVKLWDPHVRAPVDRVQDKVSIYLEHDVIVQPGGLVLEIARRDDMLPTVLKRLSELGFNAVEFSNTTSTRNEADSDAEAVRQAVELGFRVYGEIGRKFPDGDSTRLTAEALDIDRTIGEFRALLDAGAEKVYWEGHLLRRVMGDDPETIRQRASTGTREVMEVVQEVGLENIMFEVSGLRPRENRQWLQFWLVRVFGPEVNIANARIEEMPSLEAIRAGSHPIFGFGSAGNYPWIRASGEGREDWWRG